MNITQIVEDYQKLVFHICLNFTGDYFEAENLTQDTFLYYLSHYNNAEVTNPKSLLCKIASNKCLDYLKSSRVKKSTLYQPEELSFVPAGGQTPEEALLENALLQEVADCCRKLKEPYREIATAYYIENQTAAEISGRLKINLKTVQTRLYRARDKLRKQLKKEVNT